MSSPSSPSPSPKDVVIVSAVRTPIGRAKKGAFRDAFVEDLLAAVLKEALGRAKLEPSAVGDIVVGTVLGAGSQRANECRIAAFLAGIPDSVPIHTVNRQCSSGLQAVATVASAIQSGFYEVGIAAGVESMSKAVFNWEGSLNPRVFLNPSAKDCLLPMGITSENVARQFGVSREDQDRFSVESNRKAAAAAASGRLAGHILPMKVKVKDEKTGQTKEVTIDKDEGVRADTTYEGLAKLKPAFDPKGSTTAGNASQVSDGAAAVILMTREAAKRRGLPVLGVFKAFAVAGVPPSVMGIGPAFAIPKALEQAGLTDKQIKVYEINEAFASQALYSVRKLGIDEKKVNPNGGAIAIGHPLGMTGARMTADILAELKHQGGGYGVVSMCIGSGMGAAGVFYVEK